MYRRMVGLTGMSLNFLLALFIVALDADVAEDVVRSSCIVASSRRPPLFLLLTVDLEDTNNRQHLAFVVVDCRFTSDPIPHA
jgi:hypothetical protein